MHVDLSRVTFAPAKHYSQVLTQQGRVQLDADANEQAALLLRYLRALAADVIGPFGAPADDPGFGIGFTWDKQQQLSDLTIGPGHLYVDGILCENEPADEQGAPQAFTYFHQPDAFFDREDDKLPDPPLLVYLWVHERGITAIEDPSIREVALGDNGPDTAGRAKIVWQVVVTPNVPWTAQRLSSLQTIDRDWVLGNWRQWDQARVAARGQLHARARRPAGADADLCVSPAQARFRGTENQLYRVEVHRSGDTASATFKWSRENGSAVFPIRSLSGEAVTVTSLGRDAALGLEVGDWVEVVDDRYVLRGQSAPLQRVKSVHPLDLMVELEALPPPGVGEDQRLHPLLRRWDQRQPSSQDDNALVMTTGDGDQWLDLEDGIQVQFEQNARYRHGDYWLIPARYATGDIEWPRSADGDPLPRPPDGITYHSAPLALVTTSGASSPIDLRCLFDRLACPP
jgi:Family of unknown function (DUF6519)